MRQFIGNFGRLAAGETRRGRFALAIAALTALTAPAQAAPQQAGPEQAASGKAAPTAGTPADPYAPARAIIADIGKIVTPNGVDETLVMDVNGTRQVVNIRGANRANPILLYIHGGPGSVEMPMAWTFQRPWEDYFTVVQWDQRGAGRSYALNDPATIEPTLSLPTMRDDAIAVIEQLRDRLGQDKVFVLGHSFGSAVGLAVTQARPDLLHGYIGMGQLIDFRENERQGMAWTIAQARQRGDDDAVAAIKALAPYPDAGPFTIEKADGWRAFANRYGSLVGQRADAAFYFDSTRLSPLYTAQDRADWAKGSGFTVTALWPRLADVSFTDFHQVDVPVMLMMGRLDNTTPSPIAARWIDAARAPVRLACWFENSGHLPMVEEPGRAMVALLQFRAAALSRQAVTGSDQCRDLNADSGEVRDAADMAGALAAAQFLVGRWTGTGPDGKPFYEEYDRPQPGVLRSRRFASAAFANVIDSSEVRAGPDGVVSTWGAYRWRADAIQPGYLHFAPIDAPSQFSWRALADGTVAVRQDWTDADGAPQNYELVLRRVDAGRNTKEPAR